MTSVLIGGIVFPMMSSELHAAADGSIVRVYRDGEIAGTGSFADGRITGYEGEPLGATPEAHEAALTRLSARLLEQAREELAAMQREAYDEEGVDVTLIRWMLSLSPRERLRALDDHNRSLSRLLGA